MNVNRNLPTLSGQQNAQFDSVRATALAVSGTTSMSGPLVASALSGGCITDSLTFSSSTVAGSAAGLSNVAARVDLTKGGLIGSNLTVSGEIFCTGKFHGDGSLLTGISSGGGGGGGGGGGVIYVNPNNSAAALVIAAIDSVVDDYGPYLHNEPTNPMNLVGSTNAMSTSIMTDSNGNLNIFATNNLTLTGNNGNVVINYPMCYGFTAWNGCTVNIQNVGDFTINAINPFNSTAVPAMVTSGSGTTVSNWLPIFNCANTQVTYKRIYFGTTCTIVSDASIKTNVVPLPSALSFVDQLKPVSFNWTSNAMHNESDLAATNYGFIAQAVQAVNSNLVEKMENGLLSVNLMAMIPFLVKGMQELSAEVKALKASGSNV